MLVERSLYPDTEEGFDDWQTASSLVASEHIKKMQANSGHAGVAMVKYILANHDEVSKMMAEMLAKFTHLLPSPKYRFYRAHSACTIVIARISNKLNITQFDTDALYKFTCDLISDLAESVMETNSISAEDAFHRMVSNLGSRILVTTEYRHRRDGRGPETPKNRIVGDVAGRYILGTNNHKEYAGHLALSQKEVRDWCMKNRIDFQEMMGALTKEGALVKQGEKFTMTRGTDYPMIQQRCVIVDTLKLDIDSIAPALALVSSQFDGEAIGDV
jgi:hypothetical protein